MAFYVYILRCADGSYYAGHTDNLEKRIAEHSLGLVPGYTHTRRPVKLVFADAFPSRLEALERERQVKGWSRAKKEALIKANWGRLQRLARLRRAAPGRAQTSASSGRTEQGGGSARTDRGPRGLPPGKLPHDLLAALLAQVQPRDPRVLVGPGIGRDAAVIDTGGPRLLVAKTDPITFATDRIGWYAVHVNANDIACLGATPAWFLATVLLPEGADPALAAAIFAQITDACRSLAVELVGGHTEITHGLHRPIVAGAMLGEVERDRLVQPGGARPGDALIMTKGIAIEGTALLAREAADDLRRLGVPRRTISKARAYLHHPGISVVAEAMAACGAVRVHAMHDPTEGGLATALYELAEASGAGLAVQEDAIDVLSETRAVCAAAGLEPLGLLASGALLLAVAQRDCKKALAAINAAGVPARRIGAFVAAGDGVIIDGKTARKGVPRFARDEVARFLSARS
ncbi:MAG: AIR synthase-related protein [Dehalococcoidia bacterium]|nr:AIR synthase-related protein [Dehalococcoidia bacterium]